MVYPLLLAGTLLGGAAPREASLRPHILWICVDTLRPDRLGCYGAKRRTSPHLDRFARRGTLFQRALPQRHPPGRLVVGRPSIREEALQDPAQFQRGVVLFDLEADPGETVNLAAQEPGVVERLAARLRASPAGDARRPRFLPLDAAAREELERLGYLKGDARD